VSDTDEVESVEHRRLALEEERLKREVELKHAELELRRSEQRTGRLANPLLLAIVAAAFGLIGNAAVAMLNGSKDRDLERTRADAQMILQKADADSKLILQAIKTGDPESAATNLHFLVSAGLVTAKPEMKTYLEKRKRGEGPALPAEHPTNIGERRGCVVCHSIDGQPGVGPTFKGMFGKESMLVDGTMVRIDDAYIRRAILEPNAQIANGYSASMPTYSGQLSDSELDALVQYIKELR
jgi:mono/diheme cytochrome c family protein